MDVIHARCAGLDVHKKTVVACVRVTEPGAVRHEVRTFGTTTSGLLALADWLREAGCTHAVGGDGGVLEGSCGRCPHRRRMKASRDIVGAASGRVKVATGMVLPSSLGR
jgi:hypothetical protein